MTTPVDFDAAADIAGRLAPPGPMADGATLAALVSDLRSSAARAAEHVAEISGLRPVDGREPADVARIRVVDRARWAQANAEMFGELAADLLRDLPQTPAAARLAAATEVGGVLALLSGKVLGQFDPYTADAGERGRLLLVAPNVLAAERAMGVVPADFRLWVALHEQTHALQFAAAPWLAGHLRARLGDLAGGLRPGPDTGRWLLERVVDGLRDVKDVGLLAVLGREQRVVFDEVSAVMALVEGHADVTMDRVGRSVVPTVAAIRQKFDSRRDEAAAVRGPARVLRLLLGLDLKLAQYREGAAFVRGVQATVGVDGLNAVWTAPELLPTPAEIAAPAAWVARVHG
ncbi:MAG: zinc-dependent metalloprotease [Actinobacteria bacterium]|nr:zinc-dependent metalloprotease [Actinomycetota bacterium]MCG2802136.1 zinc-dependent metalloprotease [Cellulomonas sp.]